MDGGTEGVPVEVIHIVGGGTQNQLLNQFTADACARAVFAGPIEATALGNVLLQARAAGDVSSLSEIRDVVRGSETIGEYTPRDSAAWKMPGDGLCNCATQREITD